MMKYVFYLLIIIFLAFAAVQYNDPDAILWILIYSTPTYLVWKKMKNNVANETLIFAGLLFILWGANLFPPHWEGVTLDEMGMKTVNIELGRESLGLVFTGLVLAALALIKK